MEGAMIVGIYLLPTFVSCACNKRNKWIIAILNLLLGWTIIGWVVLLIVSILNGKSNEKGMRN
jgi:RsiW-degrading membrane proteinase PrsW (M82 family)